MPSAFERLPSNAPWYNTNGIWNQYSQNPVEMNRNRLSPTTSEHQFAIDEMNDQLIQNKQHMTNEGVKSMAHDGLNQVTLAASEAQFRASKTLADNIKIQ
jgi:hypothetical protein